MVKSLQPAGQAIVEHLLMLALLTGLGFLLMRGLIGNSQETGGAINTMANSTAQRIAKDAKD